MISISRQFEWDMGHRIPNHASQCKNPHGHRYKLIVEVATPALNKTNNSSSEGMVIDFGQLKKLINETIVDVFDHSFMFWEYDAIMKDFAKTNKELKMIAVPYIPTAECIVEDIALRLGPSIKKQEPLLKLQSITLYETPNCKAIWTPEDNQAKP